MITAGLDIHSGAEGGSMGVSTSIVGIAAGAILRFAVSVTTTGFNLHSIGVILMVAGVLGLILSIIFWSAWGGLGSGAYRRRRRITPDGRGGYFEEEQGGTSV
jgi:hypothetical protein